MRSASLALLLAASEVAGFSPIHQRQQANFFALFSATNDDSENPPTRLARRGAVERLLFFAVTPFLPSVARAEEENIFAPKFVQQYEDFSQTEEGWSYRDVSEGKGEAAQTGDRVVFEWSGFTIGYFGRPFQAKGGPQGGAFDKDIDYARTVLGKGQLVKGLESALAGMRPGGVRQVIVPYGALSYPADDLSHDRVGPKPTTFSGQRALNFVLDNPRGKQITINAA